MFVVAPSPGVSSAHTKRPSWIARECATIPVRADRTSASRLPDVPSYTSTRDAWSSPPASARSRVTINVAFGDGQ